MNAGRPTEAGLVTLTGLLVAASLALAACGASDGAGPIGGASPVTGGDGPSTTSPGASNDAGSSEGDSEPPPPPCDDAQTAAIQASFDDEAIPLEVGAVAMIKDRSCGIRYFTRGASKDVPETALHFIGSNTKTYVASLTLLLADEGKLSLSDSVSKWVPNVPGGDSIKVEHLLNHTSGLYNYTSSSNYAAATAAAVIGIKSTATPGRLLEVGFSEPLAFAPGAKGMWSYSNTNYVLLGTIIEKITGKSLAVALRERILTPIGAQATFFSGSESLVGDVAFGRTFSGANGATFMDPSLSWGCGNLVSSMGDLVNWTEKRGSGAFHSPAMQTELVKGAATGLDFTYGAGALIVGVTDKVLNGNGPAIGHGGDISGYHNSAYYFPAKKATIAVMVDSDAGPGAFPASGFPLGATYLEPMLMSVVNPYFGTTAPKP